MTKLTSEDGKLLFEFDPKRWSLVQPFDQLADVGKFANSKLDMIGLLDEKTLFLIEIKNIRDRPLAAFENLIRKLLPDDTSKHDPKNQPIVKETTDSVKDSLLFMALSSRYEVKENEFWQQLQNLVINADIKIFALLCLEKK